MKERQDYVMSYAEEYMDKIFFFCLKKTGNPQEAEDLTSDISLCVYSELKRGVIPEHFSAWVWQIARNRYSRWADWKRKRREAVFGSDIGDFEIVGEDRVEKGVIRQEELALLRRELAFITGDYRQILVAHYMEDKPLKEIAESLGLTEGAVKMRLLRARSMLKEGMETAREFGEKSYNPEEIGFVTAFHWEDEYPWSMARRKIPKNILLYAAGNPSTIEELCMELGIGAPYMEEEVRLLHKAGLLKKTGNRFVTNFSIVDRASQSAMYEAMRRDSEERSLLVDEMAEDLLPQIRILGAAGDNLEDKDIKWWLVIYIMDVCIKSLSRYDGRHRQRKEGELEGCIGYEKMAYPESLDIGLEGYGGKKAALQIYKIGDYGLQNRKAVLSRPELELLAELVENGRSIFTLTEVENAIWNRIQNGIVYMKEDGTVMPNVLVFWKDTMENLLEAIINHPLFSELKGRCQAAFDENIRILTCSGSDILPKQTVYCASLFIGGIRMMAVHDQVEKGRLVVPKNPESSTIAMWLMLEEVPDAMIKPKLVVMRGGSKDG